MPTSLPTTSPRLAPPTFRVSPSITVEGKCVLVPPGASLPDRCVKCNAPAEGHRKRCNLTWHNPVLYLLILLGLLIYVIVALCIRRTSRVNVGLCPRHRARRRIGIAIGLITLLASITTPFIAVELNHGLPLLLGVVMFIASLVTLVVFNQVVSPARIDPDGTVLLRGCGRAFRESL